MTKNQTTTKFSKKKNLINASTISGPTRHRSPRYPFKPSETASMALYRYESRRRGGVTSVKRSLYKRNETGRNKSGQKIKDIYKSSLTGQFFRKILQIDQKSAKKCSIFPILLTNRPKYCLIFLSEYIKIVDFAVSYPLKWSIFHINKSFRPSNRLKNGQFLRLQEK